MGRWAAIIGMLLVVLAIAAFTIQNSGFRVPLQLNLYFAAWQLSEPASVTVLMWSSFGAGGLLAWMWGAWRSAALTRKVRRLEQEVAMGSRPAKDSWAG